jgi:hypothetical protein
MNDNGTVSVKIEYDFPTEENARAAYGSAMTAIQMFRSLGNNTPRFRLAYPETFVGAEMEYMQDTGESQAEAAEWTHEMLREYMSIVQMCLFPIAASLAKTIGEDGPNKEWLLNPNIERSDKSVADMTEKEVMEAIERILSSNSSEGGIQ